MGNKKIHRVTTIVKDIQETCDGVKVFTLSDIDDWPLPPFTAGAHIDIYLASGVTRQYSLCNDVEENNKYVIAVRRDENGRGGSVEVHESISVGDELLVSLPRNHFAVVDSPRYVFVAGGIGVTPFLSIMPGLDRAGVDYQLHYCTPSSDATPFFADLEAGRKAGRIRHHHKVDHTYLNIPELIEQLGPEDHLYCCGPSRMLDEVLDAGTSLGERLHIEKFGVDASDDPAYEIELARSGRVIPVAVGQSMLNALRAEDIEVDASCEGGVCLDCKTRYLTGSPAHRDLTLPAEDRKEFLTPCVSGCSSERIVLDL